MKTAADALEQLTVADTANGLVNVTEDGGVTKRVIKAGAGPQPTAGNQVQIHYTGTLAATGEEFDSSRHTAYPFAFELGAGKVIQGWELAVAGMRVGERAELALGAAYAYGDAGCEGEPPIPPGAALVFDVELMAIDHGPGGARKAEELERLSALRAARAAKAHEKAAAEADKEARKAAALAKLAAKRQPKGKGGKKKMSKKAKAKAEAEAAKEEEKRLKKERKKAKKAAKKEEKKQKKLEKMKEQQKKKEEKKQKEKEQKEQEEKEEEEK